MQGTLQEVYGKLDAGDQERVLHFAQGLLGDPPQCGLLLHLPGITPMQKRRIQEWGVPRCRSFYFHQERCGGVLLQRPRSLKSTQRLVLTNLRNWGVKPPKGQKGWLRLVSPRDLRYAIGTSPEVGALALSIATVAVECSVAACEETHAALGTLFGVRRVSEWNHSRRISGFASATQWR